MWTNPQETASLVTFTDEILIENFIFCAVFIFNFFSKMTDISVLKPIQEQFTKRRIEQAFLSVSPRMLNKI